MKVHIPDLGRTLALLTATGLLLLGSGCGSLPAGSDMVPSSGMTSRMQYRGFSMARPPGFGDWYLHRSEQTHTHGMLRRKLASDKTHSVHVGVDFGTIPKAPASHEEFAELVRRDKIENQQRFERISYSQELTTIQGQWAIRYQSVIWDKAAINSPDRPLKVVAHGFVVNHPAFPGTVVGAEYSERGLESEMDPALAEEGNSILAGIVIESAPGRAVR